MTRSTCSSGSVETIQREAARSSGRASAEALHLARILDAHLLVAAQGEGCPVAGVLHGALHVGVERDLHLDERVDAAGRALALLESLAEGGQQVLGVELARLAGGRDVAVGDAAGEARRGGAGGSDVDRHRGFGPVVDGGVVSPVEGSVEGDALLTPQLADQRDRLLESLESLGRRRPVESECGLVERLSGSHAQDDAAGIEAPQRCEGLRHHSRVVSESRSEDRCADQDPLGPLAQRSEPGKRCRGVTSVVHPRLQVVRDEDGVEPHFLCENGVVQELAGSELLGRGFVTESERDGHHAPCRIGPADTPAGG